jgi:hypothetical protein
MMIYSNRIIGKSIKNKHSFRLSLLLVGLLSFVSLIAPVQSFAAAAMSENPQKKQTVDTVETAHDEESENLAPWANRVSP